MPEKSYSTNYRDFCVVMMEVRGEKIRAWAKSDNLVLSETCREVIAVAEESHNMQPEE
jgi:hypothetical protein